MSNKEARKEILALLDSIDEPRYTPAKRKIFDLVKSIKAGETVTQIIEMAKPDQAMQQELARLKSLLAGERCRNAEDETQLLRVVAGTLAKQPNSDKSFEALNSDLSRCLGKAIDLDAFVPKGTKRITLSAKAKADPFFEMIYLARSEDKWRRGLRTDEKRCRSAAVFHQVAEMVGTKTFLLSTYDGGTCTVITTDKRQWGWLTEELPFGPDLIKSHKDHAARFIACMNPD